MINIVGVVGMFFTI